MSKLYFLDKRDENNAFIKFKVPALNFELTNKVFAEISKLELYKILIQFLPAEYVELYFKKKIFYEIRDTSSKLVINEWNFENDKKNYLKKIEIEDFVYFDILRKNLKDKNYKIEKISNKKIIKKYFQNKKYFIFFYYLKIKNFFSKIYKKKNKINKKKVNIGVNFVEGCNFSHRNDLFFLTKNKINYSSIVYYCENKKLIFKYPNGDESIKSLRNSGVNFVKLWEWHNIKKVDFLENIKNKINLFNTKDKIEIWLLDEIKNLILRINFWYCFFEDHNIKIHFNAEEYGLSNVIQQIALKKLEGCSIGKCRSAPQKTKSYWFGYYPNDVFFAWGADSGHSISNSTNFSKNIIVSGYPYQNNSIKESETLLLKKKLLDQGVKFILLVTDGSHSENETSTYQLFPSYQMSKFLGSFLNLVVKEKELGLIIKSKKPGYLSSLGKIKNLLLEAKKTKRFYVFDDLGLEPKFFSKIVDFTIGTSVDFPSSVIQLAIYGSKCIIYDFSNFKISESSLYSWGENKVIFNDLDLMLKKFKDFMKNKNLNISLGDWSKKIYTYDMFCDNRGGERIEEYIESLKNGFDKGKSAEECLNYANKYYENKWGKDKIL